MPDPHVMTPRAADQADGLRRLFPRGGAGAQRFIGVAANAEVAFSGLALERLAAACATPERRVLVVDCASPTAAPKELAPVDLAACIEPITPQLSYLAARGLPLRHVDARGSCDNFLQAVADAAPTAGVVIVHADAVELGRCFARRELRPVLLAADHPGSVTSAYANMKVLSARHGLMAFDLLLVAAATSPRTPHIAEQLALTADRFAGTVLHDWAAIDPVVTEPGADLVRLALAQLAAGPTTVVARPVRAPLGAHVS
ncbi:MAG TPA: flagellar biosynthesis protein [Burkholderiaceae bacterium]|nr:flagellar biosynthesis protein [Burkholderiaceae bacterium]